MPTYRVNDDAVQHASFLGTAHLFTIALVLFAIVFCWTPPHTWALAMRYREDYQAANVPMLPVVRSAEGEDLRVGQIVQREAGARDEAGGRVETGERA